MSHVAGINRAAVGTRGQSDVQDVCMDANPSHDGERRAPVLFFHWTGVSFLTGVPVRDRVSWGVQVRGSFQGYPCTFRFLGPVNTQVSEV